MNLAQLKDLIAENPGKGLAIVLPDGRAVPAAFHVTEVGYVTKRFIDCGGTVRSGSTCVIQTWLGEDEHHRLTTDKLAKIFALSDRVIPNANVPVEIEHEDGVLAQYPVESASANGETLTIRLGRKHADCLAKELCLTPAGGACAPGGNCC